MYVANSDPTIWQRGGGRAGVGERDVISGEPNPCLTAGREVKLDGIWGGVASYPGKPSWPGVESCERRQKTDPDKEIPKRVGAKGCPQGSPVSPILSNIVLNELDQELERRGHRYCRWADDFLVLVKSERAGRRVMDGIVKYLEDELNLPVNKEKSEVSEVKHVPFLGFQILRGKIRVSNKARLKFKDKVRELTRRNNPLSMYKIIQDLNKYLQGWVGYFGIQEFKKLFGDIDGWIRSRLRSMQLKKWKNPHKFQRVMIAAGFKPQEAHRVWIRMNKWQSVHRRAVRFVMNLDWFRKQGLIFLNDFTKRSLEQPLFSR